VDLTSLTLSLAFHFVHSNAKAFSMFFHMLMLRLNEEEVNHGLYERKGQFLPFPINLFRREEKVCESTIRFLTVSSFWTFRIFGAFHQKFWDQFLLSPAADSLRSRSPRE
jgi:hypothetical protein